MKGKKQGMKEETEGNGREKEKKKELGVLEKWVWRWKPFDQLIKQKNTLQINHWYGYRNREHQHVGSRSKWYYQGS